MIAFTILWRPIYRYGIAYAITFLWWYFWLQWVVTLDFMKQFPKIQAYLQTSLDNFVVLILIGILLGGRLGHVFLYERGYYSQHLSEIFAFHQGGMAFLGWVIWVILMLLWIQYKNRFTRGDIKILGDLILCIVPLGIFLGRYANFLNQEMVGKVITSFPYWFQQIAGFLWLVHVYPLVDQVARFNVNLLQSFAEGFVLIVITQCLFWKKLQAPSSKLQAYDMQQVTSSKPQAWSIVSAFFIRYGVVRFLEEYTKDVWIYEYWWWLTVSQWLSMGLVISGLRISGLKINGFRTIKLVFLSISFCFCIGMSTVSAKDRSIDELIGNIEPTLENGFTALPSVYSAITGTQLSLRHEVADAYFLMDDAFYQDFWYHLKLNSAFRSYQEQKFLRETFPDLQLRITALPGTSQHHCCAIDIDKDHNTWGKKVFPWLQKNAFRFGFTMPFQDESDYGFEQEDWHFVYTPLLEEYKQQFYESLNNTLLDEINGNNFASKNHIMESYVLGIDFTKILRKRSVQKLFQQQKKTLQFLSFLHKKEALETGFVLLGTNNGVSYYKFVLDPGTFVERGVKRMLWYNKGVDYSYFSRSKDGLLFKLWWKKTFSNKTVIYVILSPSLL